MVKSVKQIRKTYNGVKDKIEEVQKPIDKLLKLRRVVEDIERGSEVKDEDSDWKDLADKFREAADELDDIPLPTDFAADEQRVSFTEFMKCSSRDESVRKLEDYLDAMRDAQAHGESALADMQEAEGNINSARAAVNYLIQVHAKLVQVAAYRDFVVWDWFTLETSVRSSLGKMQSAIVRNKKRIGDNTKLMRQKISNLEANLPSIRNIPCSSQE